MTRHDRFESAYRECFPVASSMQPDLFERDDDGYIEAKVHTAFTLWKAASATPEDHSVPVVIPEGWRLVPRTPTEGQEATGASHGGMTKNRARSAYMAMIDTAPQPPQKDADHIEARLDKPAQVGNGRFGVGVKWSTVIGAAQRHHDYMNTPEKERDRIAMGKEFFENFGAKSPQFDAQSVRDAVIEECAQVVLKAMNDIEIYDLQYPMAIGVIGPVIRELGKASSAIRALKSAPPQKPVSDEVEP